LEGGIKVHAMLNAYELVPQLIHFTDAAAHNHIFLSKVNRVEARDYFKAFSTVATVVRIHLASILDVDEMLRIVNQTWAKQSAC